MPIIIDQTQLPLVNELRRRLPILPARDRSFAESLVGFFDRRGRLTDRQWPFVRQLLDRHPAAPVVTPAAPAPVAAPPVNALSAEGLRTIEQWLDRAAGNGLRRPALRYPIGGGRTLRLSRPAATSAYAGRNVIFVRNNMDYSGRIEGGALRRAATYVNGTEEALRGILEAPFNRAVAAGRETGNCCFCGRELTDERSVSAGYGPICAGHYGLPWGGGAAPAARFTPTLPTGEAQRIPPLDSNDPNGPDEEDRNFV